MRAYDLRGTIYVSSDIHTRIQSSSIVSIYKLKEGREILILTGMYFYFCKKEEILDKCQEYFYKA